MLCSSELLLLAPGAALQISLFGILAMPWQLFRYECVCCHWKLRVGQPLESGLYTLTDRRGAAFYIRLEVQTTVLAMTRGRQLRVTTVSGLRCATCGCGSESLELTGSRFYDTPAWYDVSLQSALRNHGVRVYPRVLPID